MAEPLPVYIIDLNEDRNWGECSICEKYKRLDHAVGWYCGPTHDEIGSITTEYSDGGVVGGMRVCRECHDGFYLPLASTEAGHEHG
ncbi:hypothetical protein ACO2RV_16900 [Ancylobacter sp. VNQ12]|uniref:hypothetical protein n=1 Tax=Ancylobacter sp. VNQ12 TaxID=3400920 RepID=UPI003C0A3B5C